MRAELVGIDDAGLLPVDVDAAEGLYRIVDAAYERHSVAVSSNLHPSGFDELMPKTLATATVDRLLHRAHVCQTSGDSVRLAISPTRERSPPNLTHPAAGRHTLMGRFVSGTRQSLLATYTHCSCPPAGSAICPLTLIADVIYANHNTTPTRPLTHGGATPAGRNPRFSVQGFKPGVKHNVVGLHSLGNRGNS